MRLLFLFRICAALALTGMLAACQGKMVTVTDEAAFEAMALRAAPALRSHGVLDGDDAYLTSLFTTPDDVPQDAGERLFRRLSPAFRFRNTDPSMLPASFAQAKSPGDTLHMSPTGFILTQGEQRVAVSLLGLTDWNDTKTQSWLVQCRVLWPNYSEERTYYMVVEDPSAAEYQPLILAIYDCRQGRCVTYRDNALAQDTPTEDAVVDLLPGQQDITAPPRMP